MSLQEIGPFRRLRIGKAPGYDDIFLIYEILMNCCTCSRGLRDVEMNQALSSKPRFGHFGCVKMH